MSKGISLVEFLTAFGLAAFILIILASFYFTQFKFFTSQSTSIDVSGQNKIAIDEITNEIRESQSVAATCCSTEASGTDSLVLQIWPIDSSGETLDPLGTNYDYIIYKRDTSNNTLTKTINPSQTSSRTQSTKIIASNITSLVFEYDQPTYDQTKEVTLTVTTTQTASGKTHSQTQKSSAILRNK